MQKSDDLAAATESPAAAPVVGEELVARVVSLVAEQTGYPAELLDLDLDLEADLGIDTVKQAELFAQIRETYGIERDDQLKLRDYPTLNHVVGFVRDRLPRPTAAVAPAPIAPVAAAPVITWAPMVDPAPVVAEAPVAPVVAVESPATAVVGRGVGGAGGVVGGGADGVSG